VKRALLVAASIAAAVAVTAAAASKPPRLAGCIPGTPSTVRPGKIIVACGDANFYFTNLGWSSWNAKQAIARGLAQLNDCKPTCAAGHFHTYRSTVTLSRPRSCSDGIRAFTRMAWQFQGTVPSTMKPRGSQSLPCR
jgi:hypothetical protein